MLDVESLLAENMGCILFYFVAWLVVQKVLFYGSVISLMLSIFLLIDIVKNCCIESRPIWWLLT